MNLFLEITLILVLAAGAGAVGLLLRQPLITAFLAVGILVGPSGLDLLSAHAELELLAELGIALLLFVVGLRLDVHLIQTLGPVAFAAGLAQMLATAAGGYGLMRLLGASHVPALYVAAAVSFSSTVIIVKLLSDKREIDALHGRIAVGVLIVQDIAVVVTMIALAAAGGAGAEAGGFAEILASGVLFLSVLALLARHVLPRLLHLLARSRELLMLFAVAWAVFLAEVGDLLGASKEVGAFLAGVSIASTPYREAIAGRLTTLRDFLLLFFFIHLGAGLDLARLGAQLAPALVLSLFVLVGKPLVVLAILGALGYRKRTGFLAGTSLAQISEFSLILVSLGADLGHIGPETTGLVTWVALVTIALSTYLILYAAPLYDRLAPMLGVFERRIRHREDEAETAAERSAEVIVFGLGRYGRNICEHLIRRGKRVLGVDFDPEAVRAFRAAGRPARYGDAEDPELFDHLPLAGAEWVVNTNPSREVNRHLLQSLRSKGYEGKIVLTAENEADARRLEGAGADRVLRPYDDAAEQAADALTATIDALSARSPWPMSLTEVRLPSDSVAAGQRIEQLDLRAKTGATIVAVDRGGRSRFDPGADFRLFPGDRVVLLGEEEALKKARSLLGRAREGAGDGGGFRIEKVAADDHSEWIGKSLAELGLRRRYDVSVIGIEREEERISSPQPSEKIRAGDALMVLGSEAAIERLTAPAKSNTA